MNNFIKVTDASEGLVWISKYQIVSMVDDERHSQTFILCSGGKEFTVREKIKEILEQLGE